MTGLALGPYAVPGMGTEVSESARNVFWGSGAREEFKSNQTIVSTAVDSGASPTTLLRAGLLLGKITSTGKLVQYTPTAVDGSQNVYGVLTQSVNMYDAYAGAVADRNAVVACGGPVIASSLTGLDRRARDQMAGRFIFDDEPVPAGNRISFKAANYTVTAADHGTKFHATTGAVTFTLPTKANGLMFEFVNTVNADMAILSAGSADDIIAIGDAGADSVTFSTTSEKIGSHCRVECTYIDGTNLRWIVSNLGGTTATVG